MAAQHPTHQDAELVLRLYDLRRETVMRESRDAMNRDFLPKSYAEFKAVTSDMKHPLNRPFRQTSSYWEMCYGFAKHGIISADFLIENNGEGLFLFAKIEPYLEEFRREFSPTAFQNTEWLVKNSTVAKQRLEVVRKRIAAMKEA